MTNEKLITLLQDIKSTLHTIAMSDKFDSSVSHQIQNLWMNEIVPLFDHLISEIRSGKYTNKLEKSGLSGEHLKLKYTVWHYLQKQFVINPEKFSDKIFYFINSLLSSLLFIPGIDMIKEFKDMLHLSLDKEHMVFLLEPIHDKTLCKKKLIWSSNEDMARTYAEIVLPSSEQRTTEGIYIGEETVYWNDEKVSCKELVEGKEYRVISEDIWADQMEIELIEKKKHYSLAYNTPVDLE